MEYYNKNNHSLLITECIKESKIIKYHISKHKNALRELVFTEIYKGIIHFDHGNLIKLYKFARKNKFSVSELKNIIEECLNCFKNSEDEKMLAQVIITILDKKILNKKYRYRKDK